MSAYSTLYSCSIGGVAFQLINCTYSETPIFDESAGRTETTGRIHGEGWIEATSESALATAFGAAIGSFTVPGRNVIIYGLNGQQLVSMLAAQSLHGGPDIEFEISDGDEPAKKMVKFTATASWGVNRSGPYDAYDLTADVNADGRRLVTRSGKVIGPGAVDYFTNTLLPAVRAAYPVNQWAIIGYRAETNPFGDRSTYEIRIEQLSEPLPGDGAVTVFDGTAQTRTARNEQMRLTTIFNYDLLISGDPVALQTLLRPARDVYRESMEFTRYKGTRVRLEFQQLAGGDGNNLLDFQQSFEMDDGSTTHEAITWPGLKPGIVLSDPPARTLRQSGYAIAANGSVVKPAVALYPDAMQGPGKIGFTSVNEFETRTTWDYAFLFVDAIDPGSIINSVGRQLTPEFF